MYYSVIFYKKGSYEFKDKDIECGRIGFRTEEEVIEYLEKCLNNNSLKELNCKITKHE